MHLKSSIDFVLCTSCEKSQILIYLVKSTLGHQLQLLVMDSTLKDQGTKFTSKIPRDQKTLSRIKVNIPQSVPTDRVRKGPSCVVRSLALNDNIEITRKFGEGSIPIFEREGVVANSIVYNESSVEDKSTNVEFKKDRSFSQSDVKKTEPSKVTKSKRGEYTHRGCCGAIPIPKSSNESVNKNWTISSRTKVPYYRDEVRECDRLRRLYGESRRPKSRSLSPPSSSKYRSRRRSTRSTRSRSTSRDRHQDYSTYEKARGDSSNDHRSRRSHSRTHTPHRERPRQKQSSRHSRDSHSPCCSHKRHLNDDRRTSRSHSSSSQHARSSRDRDNESETNNYETRVPPPSTYIPVPVPVADYAFSFPHWPVPQNPWSQHIPHRAPGAPFTYPLVPFMPPIRPVRQIRYMVPPPVSYVPMTSGAYRPRPAYRYPHSKQNVANAHNRYKHQDRHK